jgi:hypothetical protein
MKTELIKILDEKRFDDLVNPNGGIIIREIDKISHFLENREFKYEEYYEETKKYLSDKDIKFPDYTYPEIINKILGKVNSYKTRINEIMHESEYLKSKIKFPRDILYSELITIVSGSDVGTRNNFISKLLEYFDKALFLENSINNICDVALRVLKDKEDDISRFIYALNLEYKVFPQLTNNDVNQNKGL